MAALSLNEIEDLIARFGPTLVPHPEEKYRLDDPEVLLETGQATVQWGLVSNEDDYDTFSLTPLGEVPVASGESLLKAEATAKQDPNVADPRFRYWLNIPSSLNAGDLARARAQVVVTHADQQNGGGPPLVQLQFWFFYGYNGPAKFHLRVGEVYSQDVEMDTSGRHSGDWEHVTLELVCPAGGDSLSENSSVAANWQLRRVYLSRHSLTIWADRSELTFDGDHPLIYAARDSHAHYASPGLTVYERVAHVNFYLGHLDVDLYDLTADGSTHFPTSDPDKHIIVSQDLDSSAAEPATWTGFAGRWGQYLRNHYEYKIPVIGIPAYSYNEVGSGPHGPLQHGSPVGSDIGFVACRDGGRGVIVVSGRPYAFVQDSDGHLACNWWTDKAWVWADRGCRWVARSAVRWG